MLWSMLRYEVSADSVIPLLYERPCYRVRTNTILASDRRAVIIVDIIMIAMSILNFIGFAFAFQTIQDADIDDAVKEDLTPLSLGWMVVWQTGLVICLGFGIMGALRYNKTFVIIALIAYISTLVLDFLTSSRFDMLVDGLFLYPHVMLWQELKNGIMTPHNYEYEKQWMDCSCIICY